MNRPTTLKWTLAAATLLALVLGGGALEAAQDTPGDDDQQRVIKIKKRVQCAGDDCGDAPHAVFISKDGDSTVVDTEGMKWVAGDDVHKIVHRMHGGKAGFLGVQMTELTAELRTHFGVPEDSGVMISKIVEDSPAERAGLRVGDIVTLVDGEGIGSARALGAAIGELEDGSVASIEVWRDGRAERIAATIEVRERKGMMHGMGGLHLRHGDGDHGERHVIFRHGDGEGMAGHRQIRIECDSDADECGGLEGLSDFDCGADDCEVRVECTDDGCTCTINGEDADCAGIPGVPGH